MSENWKTIEKCGEGMKTSIGRLRQPINHAAGDTPDVNLKKRIAGADQVIPVHNVT